LDGHYFENIDKLVALSPLRNLKKAKEEYDTEEEQ
jgi:hypothetical protein